MGAAARCDRIRYDLDDLMIFVPFVHWVLTSINTIKTEKYVTNLTA